jgi:CheY-like chemotaxis protein
MKVTLPRVAFGDDEVVVTPPIIATSTGGVILVAEDEPMVRAHIVRTLERAGHVVLEAENGQRAVEIFKEKGGQVDLLLLDAIMPVLDGWHAFLQISKLKPGIKVLFATGYAADVLPTDVASVGARLLNKPFKTSALLAEVHYLLQRRLPVGSGT